MKFFVSVCVLLAMQMTFAATEIKGYIRKDLGVMTSRNLNWTFPQKHYDIDPIVFRSRHSINFAGKQIEPQRYHFMDSAGGLDLIDYNLKSGYIKYRLSVQITRLCDTSISTSLEHIPLEGQLLFDANKNPAVYIEGKVSYRNNKLFFETINAGDTGFALSFSEAQPDRLILTPLREISITVNANANPSLPLPRQ